MLAVTLLTLHKVRTGVLKGLFGVNQPYSKMAANARLTDKGNGVSYFSPPS